MTNAHIAAVLAALESDASAEAGGRFVALAAGYLADTRSGEGPVSTPHDRRTLSARFDQPLPRGITPLDEVVRRLGTDVLPDVNRLTHPRYLGHQVSAPLAAAVWTEMVIGAVNNSQAVWEMSPVTTPIEERVIGWMAQLCGFGPAAGGTFTSGATEATLTALLAARAAWRPDAWSRGIGGGPAPVLVHGEHAHYAMTRAAGVMGLGTANCVSVRSTDAYRMDPTALEATLERLRREARDVLAVVATAGCTAVGAFDDLEAIGTLCDRFGVWLHVDGAHGASALLSAAHRGQLAGIERARSVAWDPHKMMLMPLAAGMLLVRDARDLDRAFSQEAPYLFHDTGDAPTPDLGKRSLQCSRRADVLKVWVALQRLGADGLGALYDHLCALTAELHARLAGDPQRHEMLHVPEGNILCWRPRGRSDEEVAALRERYNRSDAGWITSTMLGGRRVLRVTVMNPRTTIADLELP